jgi:hypothetical protein
MDKGLDKGCQDLKVIVVKHSLGQILSQLGAAHRT